MSKKKQPKPAKRRASAGENIAKLIDPEGTITAELWRRRISGKIDRAIRAAVKEAWYACENHESENSESHKAQIKGQIEQRFGVKL